MSDRRIFIEEACEHGRYGRHGADLDGCYSTITLLANGQRVEPDYEAARQELIRQLLPGLWPTIASRAIVDAAIGDKLLIDPTTEEEPIDSDVVVSVEFDPMGGLNPPTEEE